MTKKIELVNYYDELSEKQKKKLDEKVSICAYYSYYDEIKKYGISNEDAGILFLALTFYGRTHGTEPIPAELAEHIENNPFVCYIFETWCQRERQATLNWVNHRGGNAKTAERKPKIETVILNDSPFGKVKLTGEKKNMPTEIDENEFEIVEADNFDLFIDYGNEKKWCKPWRELLNDFMENDE